MFFSAISNSLALGSALEKNIRKFPPLRSCGLKTVVFRAYSDVELKSILDRRFELTKDEVLHEYEGVLNSEQIGYIKSFELIEYCAIVVMLKRLAAHQGDCRQMLDLCRSGVD